jgi:hypothetical protein
VTAARAAATCAGYLLAAGAVAAAATYALIGALAAACERTHPALDAGIAAEFTSWFPPTPEGA